MKDKKKKHIIHDASEIPKKNMKNGFLNGKPNKYGYKKYKNTNFYTKIVADPELLPSTPVIFKPKAQINRVDNFSNSFLTGLFTNRCFDSDTKTRYNFSLNSIEKKPENEKIKNVKKKHIHSHLEIQEKEKEEDYDSQFTQTVDSVLGFDTTVSDEEKMVGELSYVDTYKAMNNKALIFHMHYPCSFSFHGEIKVELINGEVEIVGLTLSESSKAKAVDVYSPNSCFPLTVKTNLPSCSKSPEEIKDILSNVLSESDIITMLSKIKSNDSILLIQQIISPFGQVLNKYFDESLFPKDLESVSSLSETLRELQSVFTFGSPKNSKEFRKSSEWDKIPLGQCTVLCGGKGVGKSTLLKYFINKLIEKEEKILCLDFDPGQPEFTPPGCVSAVILDKPLLGPNFTHVTDPKLMVYFGEIDVCQGPAKYLECVNYIIQQCKMDHQVSKMKWFVNTMGFCKGLGVDLMISILKLLEPNTVIQIKSVDHKKNYPFYLTPISVNSKKGFKSINLDGVHLLFDLRVVNSCAEVNGKALQGGLKPRQLRDIMTISYFSRLVGPPYHNFNAVSPHIISFSNLYLGIDFLIPPNDLLKAFNGNIVSLTHFKPGCEEILELETDSNSFFKIVVKPSLAPCVALGFVRGIDCKERKFYILTHLSDDDLENVNCLSLGRISPPHSMFLKQETVVGEPVYTSFSNIDIVHRVKRMFRVPAAQQIKEKNNRGQ